MKGKFNWCTVAVIVLGHIISHTLTDAANIVPPTLQFIQLSFCMAFGTFEVNRNKRNYWNAFIEARKHDTLSVLMFHNNFSRSVKTTKGEGCVLVKPMIRLMNFNSLWLRECLRLGDSLTARNTIEPVQKLAQNPLSPNLKYRRQNNRIT